MQKINKIYLYSTIVIIVILAIFGIYYLVNFNQKAAKPSSNSTQNSSSNSRAGNNQSNTQNPTQSNQTNLLVTFPISNFNARITKNPFGKHFTVSSQETFDRQVCSRSVTYTGYHTGVDLEAFASEQSSAVPIYSIASGTVRQASYVGGYGDLIVIQYTINKQIYTAYYGHIDLSTIKVRAGDKVTKGEELARLAPTCSQANDYVRKHLHFALHKGSAIDVRGYVPNQTILNNWVDPKIFFANLGLR